MFSTAIQKAAKYTHPVITSTYSVGQEVNSGCAAYTVINRDGWFITAGHVFDGFHKFQEDQKKLKEYEKMKAENPNATFELDKDILTNQSFWFGDDKLRISQVYVNMELDFALGKLENFTPDMIKEYPIFKDPSQILPGTSLCRLGYPFIKNVTEFNTENRNFKIKNGVLPLAIFPNDGIITRFVSLGKSSDGYDMKLIEMSTPGLKGQSGGPIFDSNGFVAGIQTRTNYLDIGFSPSYKNDKGEMVTEHQFLGVGLGVHASTIMAILDDKKVKYHKETDDKGFRIMD